MVNLHHLRVFHEVAKCGSVTRAAAELCVSQPAVSVQVKRLEEELCVELLRAEGRGVRLTEAGEALAVQARRLFALEREIEAKMWAWREGREGSLRIGGTNSTSQYLLPQLAAMFKRERPEVEVQVIRNNSRLMYDALHEYRVDVALMAGGWEEPGIEKEVVLQDELWWVVPAGHRLSGQEVPLSEVATEPFLVREEGSSTRRRQLALFEVSGLELPVGLVMTGMQETVRAVESGYGLALLPSLAVRDKLARGVLGRVKVMGVQVPFAISLCMRAGEAEVSPAVQRFRELARVFCKGVEAQMRGVETSSTVW